MDKLVQRLAIGDHPVAVRGPAPTLKEFRKHIEQGYVIIGFKGKSGTTDLGVVIDRYSTNLGQADFERATGIAHIVGILTLNEVSVRCVADIQLETLQGTGHLEIRD